MRKILLPLLLLVTASAYADFTAVLDAGKLRIDAANPMATGSLLILIRAGGDGSFSNSLSAGQYVSGNDVLLSSISFTGSSGAFNNSGGTDETINTLTNLPDAATGDLLALRWFPQITKAQFDLGTTPSNGQNFGIYNPLFYGNGSNMPDGGAAWAVPSGGATINLNFFTTDSDFGGSQNPTEGYASFVVGAAVPETSTVVCGFLSAGALAFHAVRRRIKR